MKSSGVLTTLMLAAVAGYASAQLCPTGVVEDVEDDCWADPIWPDDCQAKADCKPVQDGTGNCQEAGWGIYPTPNEQYPLIAVAGHLPTYRGDGY